VVFGTGASALNRRWPAQTSLEGRGCGLSLRPPRPVDPNSTVFEQQRSSRFTLSHTPLRCHSPSRRQAVTPREQPICRGTISHGTPVTSTNTIAVNALSDH
jgi:hypothetical protein